MGYREPSKTTLTEFHELLKTEVDQLTTTPAWKSWLDMAATFRRYSFNNVLMIKMQRPDATMVNSYRRWQQLGRQVQKGEKGIKIFAPLRRKMENDDGEREFRIVGYRLVPVFDVSQTEGDELPTAPEIEPVDGDAPEDAWLQLVSVAVANDFTVTLTHLPGRVDGRTNYSIKSIAVDSRNNTGHQVVTLAHELAHMMLHDGEHGHRGLFEIEAESVAYLVGTILGIDTNAQSFGYIASWMPSTPQDQRRDVIEQMGNRVVDTAHTILGLMAPTSPELEQSTEKEGRSNGV